MTEPIRWSDPASDADPVLRAVVRYAQHIEPSAHDVGSLATIVAREESRLYGATPGRALRASLSRPMVHVSLAFALVAGAGIAFGMTLTRAFDQPPGRAPAVSADRAHDVESKRPLRAPVGLERPQPVASALKTTRNRARSVAPATPTSPAESASSPAAPAPSAAVVGAADDVALLAAARRDLKTQPKKTLALLAEHERRFAGSSFGEERAALQIEALFGLARRAEAERAYAAFNAKFPGSIYGLRLAAARQR